MVSTISSLFADVFLTTGPTTASGEEDVINEMQRRTYFTSFVMKGAENFTDYFQGGDRIQDDILLDSDSTYGHYDPDDEFTYRSSENLSQWTVNWRFSKAHMKFTDHEVELNGGGPGATGAQLHDRFKNLLRTKKQNFWTTICNGVEDDWFVAPHNANMEADTGLLPYSIFCFVNDYTADSPAAASTTLGLPVGFTNVEGIAGSKGRWQPIQEGYGTDPGVTSIVWDGWKAFSNMRKKTEFHRMPKRSEMGEGHTYPGMIATSEEGATGFEMALQVANDPLSSASRGKGDPSIGELQYKGASLDFFQGLSEAGAYGDGSGGAAGFVPEFTDSVDQDGVTILTKFGLNSPTVRTGARYLFLDNRYLRVFFKRGRMFKTAKIRPEKQPWSTVVVVDLWHNNYCRSRQRLGCVYPTAALGRPNFQT